MEGCEERKRKMARGILYLMETAVPGLVKIGKTGEDNFERRMYELERNGYANVTGLQRRYAIAVDDFDEKEQLLHDVFGKSRLEGTEFFAVDVEMVAALMASLAGEQVYPGDEEEITAEQEAEKAELSAFDVNDPVCAEEIHSTIVRYLTMEVPAGWDKMEPDERAAYFSRYDGICNSWFSGDIQRVMPEQLWKEALGFPGTPSDDGLREIIRAVCSLKGWEKSIYVGGINGYENGNGFFNPKAKPAPEPVKSESEKTASDPYVKAIAGYLAMKVPAGWDKMSKSERITYKRRYDVGMASGDFDIVKTTTAQLWNEALNETEKPSQKDARRIGDVLCGLMGWKKEQHVSITGYPRSRGFSR